MENNNLPLQDLKKYGIVSEDNTFSTKLSQKDIEAFLKGSTIIAEDDKNRLTFNLKDDNSRLEVNVYNKDIINHKELSSAELYEIADKRDSLYKVMSDYGTITKIGQDHFNGNPKNEMSSFVEIENERGKAVFYGNDLLEKLKGFKEGDKIQIENTGLNKTTFKTALQNEVQDIVKFDNVFSVKTLEENNKKFQSKLFEYDSKSKTVVDLDTTKYELKSVNGVELSNQQLDKLRKGKEVKLDDDLIIQLSPKANNKFNLSSNNRNLLIVSLMFDAGISFLIVKGVQRLAKMVEENRKQNEGAKYKAELERMKSFLHTKAKQYPDDNKIKSDLNIVSKEISNVTSRTTAGKPQEKNDTSVKLQVNDYDTYEDANRKKEEKRNESQEQRREVQEEFREEGKSKGRGR